MTFRLISIACNILGKCFSKKAASSLQDKQQQIFSKNNELKKMCTNVKQKENLKVKRYFKNLLMSNNFRKLPQLNAMKSKLLRLG